VASRGQRAQLALTLAVAKRPELLILDEPVASLDPLARREFLQDLMETVADQETSVVLSSHLVADLERVCDYLIVLCSSRGQVAGEVDKLLATHHLLTGPRRDPATLPSGQHVISASQHLIPPVRATSAFNPAAVESLVWNGSHMTVTAAVNMPGAWVISNQIINAAGQVFTGPATPACLSHKGFQACAASLAKLHPRQLITHQPASRYWALQWYETAFFLALALALAGFCFWRIRRRLS
jgi:hypothetical protein